LPAVPYHLACLFLVLILCLGAEAQVPEPNSNVLSERIRFQEVPRVPGVSTFLSGLNAGITFSEVHDSSIRWYTLTTPAVSYTFSEHFSADASVSIYPYRMVQIQPPPLPPASRLSAVLGDVGDSLIGFHASFNSHFLRNTTTAYLTLPTGNRSDGLGTGKVTYDFSNRMEHFVRRTAFILDVGAGNSSGSFNNLVTKDYSSLGTLAHFQAGVAVRLPGRSYIQSLAYEQLPIGSQTVFLTLSPPGAPNSTMVRGSKLSEDNGITTSLSIPLNAHLTWSGYYNRSLRQHVDTVSTGFTYVLRGSPRNKRLSMIDRALREAEGANP
jgi:hypothetical protein